jgi:hypothetical protein
MDLRLRQPTRAPRSDSHFSVPYFSVILLVVSPVIRRAFRVYRGSSLLQQVRIDVYSGKRRDRSSGFEDAIFWHGWVVIGFGEQVFLVSPSDYRTITLELGSCFGHLYPLESCLLVASCERLFAVRVDGDLVWTTEVIGIDGVVIDRVVGTRIEGQGEWDPPDGWRPFRVDLRSGDLLHSVAESG